MIDDDLTPERIEAFLSDLTELSRRHGVRFDTERKRTYLIPTPSGSDGHYWFRSAREKVRWCDGSAHLTP